MSPTDTPRTERFIDSCGDYEKWRSYRDRLHEFARSLERENAALKAENERLQKDAERLAWPVEPTEEMVDAARGIPQIGHSSYYWRQVILNVLAAAPTPPAQEIGLPVDVLNALRFYANGEHFSIDGDAQEFDTVSGEPDNWLHSQRDEDCTMIEDGSIARAVLQGKVIHGDVESRPVEGEVYGVAPPAQEDEPVAVIDESDDGKFADLTIEGTFLKRGARLYTHPDNSELKKAAEEFLRASLLADHRFLSDEHDRDHALAVKTLRAALEGK